MRTYLGCRLRVRNHEKGDKEEEGDGNKRLEGRHGWSSFGILLKYYLATYHFKCSRYAAWAPGWLPYIYSRNGEIARENILQVING
jgi:hypothetical protein